MSLPNVIDVEVTEADWARGRDPKQNKGLCAVECAIARLYPERSLISVGCTRAYIYDDNYKETGFMMSAELIDAANAFDSGKPFPGVVRGTLSKKEVGD